MPLTPLTTRKKLVRRISRGHQVTLPPHFLTANNLHTGDNVEVIEEEGKVIIQPFDSTNKRELIEKIQILFGQIDKNKSTLPIDEQLLLATIDQEIEAMRHSKK